MCFLFPFFYFISPSVQCKTPFPVRLFFTFLSQNQNTHLSLAVNSTFQNVCGHFSSSNLHFSRRPRPLTLYWQIANRRRLHLFSWDRSDLLNVFLCVDFGYFLAQLSSVFFAFFVCCFIFSLYYLLIFLGC